MKKVSLCSQNNCVTVYGETAKFVNAVVAVIAVIALVSAVSKAFK